MGADEGKVSCWKVRGVWGQEVPKCSELEKVVHCRNCEVFTSEGRRLLERDCPDAYREAWTEILGAEKEDEPAGLRTVIVFRVGPEWLSLPVAVFSEVVEMQKPRSVPHRKDPVFLGLVNVHGELQLCFSMQKLLHLGENSGENGQNQNPESKTRPLMVVINENSDKWVFPADFIQGTRRVHPERMRNVPVTVSKSRDGFTRAIFETENGDVALLDEQAIFRKLRRCVQ